MTRPATTKTSSTIAARNTRFRVTACNGGTARIEGDTTMTSDLEQLLDSITDQLRRAEQRQRQDTDPAHEDFYLWGAALTDITETLGQVCRTLAPQVSAYGRDRLLRDDEGGAPQARLDEMRVLLDSLYSTLHLANTTARDYHSSASHIAVEVDPDATSQDAVSRHQQGREQ